MDKNKLPTPNLIVTPPIPMDYDLFDESVFAVCQLLKEKGLTIKQAQAVLKCSAEMILESLVGF